MKKLTNKIFAVLLVLLTCFPISVLASEDNGPAQIPVTPIPDPHPTPGGNRARARARYVPIEPQCFFYNGELTIEGDEVVTIMTASVVRAEDNETWNESGSGNSLTLIVTEDPGTYYLYFTLSNGNSYIGKYILY